MSVRMTLTTVLIYVQILLEVMSVNVMKGMSLQTQTP